MTLQLAGFFASLAANLIVAVAHAQPAGLVVGGPAQGPGVLALVRANQWAQADAAAAQWIDPVARKLVAYYRMEAQGAASVSEIDAFIHANPGWPGQPTLLRRREEALAAEPDDNVALPFCAHLTLTSPAALLRCADGYEHAGQSEAAAGAARQAWLLGITDPAGETKFMQRWGGAITPQDQWRRFNRVALSDQAATKRQLARLDTAHRQAAEVLLALHRDDPKAETMLAALPAELRFDPALMLEEAARLRRAQQYVQALELWQSRGTAAQEAAAPERLPGYWAERDRLARDLLRAGDATGALSLVTAHGPLPPEQTADAEFLAGWIALRWLNDPTQAVPHFQALADASKAAITQARAHYWLARCDAARKDPADMRAQLELAAKWPTTFYGQLAAVALGDTPAELNARILALRDPAWTPPQAVTFLGRELARAAMVLVAWGEPWRARPFLLRLQDASPDPIMQSMAARLALGFGLPDQAVAIARHAGRDGLILADTGWPTTVTPPAGPVEPAVTLGVIRQESGFDVNAASPAGARGLMQLMPGTAADMARQLGVQPSLVSLTGDPQENMKLGTTYLQGLLDRFGGSLALALAAYNAGPGHVLDWLTTIGDPRAGAIDMIDWIELIPFGETRNYVQRVIENVAVYRARLGVTAPYPLAPWRG